MSVGGTGAAPKGILDQGKKAVAGIKAEAEAVIKDAIDHHQVITVVALAALSAVILLGLGGVMPFPTDMISDLFGGGGMGNVAMISAVLGSAALAYWGYRNKDKSKLAKVAFLVAAAVFVIFGASLLAKGQKLMDFSSYAPITANAIGIGSGALALGMAYGYCFKTNPTLNKVLAVTFVALFLLAAAAVNALAYNTAGPGVVLLTGVGSAVALPWVAEKANQLWNKNANTFKGMRPERPPPPPVIAETVRTVRTPPTRDEIDESLESSRAATATASRQFRQELAEQEDAERVDRVLRANQRRAMGSSSAASGRAPTREAAIRENAERAARGLKPRWRILPVRRPPPPVIAEAPRTARTPERDAQISSLLNANAERIAQGLNPRWRIRLDEPGQPPRWVIRPSDLYT